MSLFGELKRRNVFRVGVAYAITAWLLVQVADILFEAIGTPAWAMQTLLVFLGLGFVVALFFAWAFELTPEGIKREEEVDRTESITPQTGKKLNNAILVLMALAIAYLLFDKFSGAAPLSRAPTEQSAASSEEEKTLTPGIEATVSDSASAVSRQSIAVLPFDNRSEQKSDEFFVEGIHDDLLTNLSRIGSLKVISRTSVTKYRDTEKTIPEIASELGVATIMEGAVQRAGNQVRINVQLIDAQTDEHLWAEIFDRELTAENLFVIQSEISQAIADALRATLTSEEQQRISTIPTQNLAAYEAYLRGRQLMASRESDKLEQAIESFMQATELDPNFALAWVGMSDSHALLSVYGTLPRAEARAVMQHAIEQAMSIDDQLGEAWVSLAGLHEWDNDWAAAEAAYLKAFELSPNYAQAYHWYSNDLKAFPLRVDEVIEHALKAVELDPNSSVIGTNLASAYQNKGLYSMAERQFKKVIELDPGFARGHAALAEMLTFPVTRLPDALHHQLRAVELDPGNVNSLSTLMMIYLELGDSAAAEAVRQRMTDLDKDHFANGMSDAFFNSYSANAAGVQEAASWTLPKLKGMPGAVQGLAFMLASTGKVEQARRIYLAAVPGWLDPARWDQLVAEYSFDACVVAWILLNTGDEEAGSGLLKRASRYLEEELPAVVEHADVYWPHVCQLTRGDTEAALDTIESLVSHDHLFAWTIMDQLPMLDLIRDDPRYIAAMQKRNHRIAQQLAEIEALELGAGP